MAVEKIDEFHFKYNERILFLPLTFVSKGEKLAERIRNSLILVSIYVLILTLWGFENGRGDHMQMAYAQKISGEAGFSGDFYIQSLVNQPVNERTFFAWFISLGCRFTDYWCFLLHAFFSMILLWGLKKTAGLFIRNELLNWLVLLVLFIPLYKIHLGSNELYYNSMIPSLAAKATGIWGLYYFLKKNYLIAGVFLVFATAFHPLAGAQLGFLLVLVMVFDRSERFSYLFFLLFLLLIVPFSWTLWSNYNDAGGGDLMDSFFRFRNMHHYFPSVFPLKNILILVPAAVIALLYYYGHSRRLFWFFVLWITGAIIYTAGLEFFDSETIASTQWFKASVWIEFLSVTGILALADKFSTPRVSGAAKWIFCSVMTITAVVCVLGVVFSPGTFGKGKKFDMLSEYRNDAATDISHKAYLACPGDAVFVTPLTFTELKWYGHLSSWVDYEAPVHQKSALAEWMRRLEKLYRFDHRKWVHGPAFFEEADRNFYSAGDSLFLDLGKEGVTHLITRKEHKLGFPVVVSNEVYQVYKIMEPDR